MGEQIRSIRELAKRFNVSYAVVSKWRTMGCPGYNEKTGRRTMVFDLDEVREWLKENQSKDYEKPEEPKSPSDPSQKVKIEQARRLKRLNDVAEGELISAVEAQNEALKVFRTVWDKFILLRETIPALVAKKSVKEVDVIVGREFERTTEELKKEIEKLNGKN